MRFLVVTVKIALRALCRNARRSFLTILGIIIGVAAVIAMLGIGRGATASVQAKIASLGDNMLVIMSGSTTQGGILMGLGALPRLTVNAAKAILREAPAVAAVTYGKRQVAQVMAGSHNCNLADLAATAESTSRIMRILLASVASVSLLVGGSAS